MNENNFTLTEPRNVATSDCNPHSWVSKIFIFSSIAFSFGNASANSDIVFGDNIFYKGRQITISETLVRELNLNVEIKERLISRLIEFRTTLKYGWNGGSEHPMEEQAVSNALDVIDAVRPEELAKWTVFPSPNGTILFSPTDDLVAGISIGNTELSYAALGNKGQEVKGKEIFSVKSFKLAIKLINSLNEV